MPEQPFDKRLIKRRMRKGQLDSTTLQKHLDSLEDLADKCEVIEATVGPEPDEEAEDENED